MALPPVKKNELAKEMATRRYQDCIELERAKIDKRNKYQNLNRYMEIQKTQMESAGKIENEKQKVALHAAEVARKERLAQEIQRKKNEDVSDMCLRQQLRQDSQELRELERKLRAAYVNKQLLTQLAEKESERLQKKVKDREAQEQLEIARTKHEEFTKMVQEKDMQRKAKYKQELQDQMILEERMKRFQYEEFLREKKKIDDIVQRIHDEDEREIQEKVCRIQRTREEMEKFKEAQEIWKAKCRAALVEEDQRLTEYLQAKAREQHLREVEKHKQNLETEKRMENIARDIYVRQQKHKERQEVYEALKAEECLFEYEERERQAAEKQMKQRNEMRQVLDYQLKEREEKIRKEAEEDAAYVKQVLDKLAEENKLEQMSGQKKRMKMLQLRRDAEEMTRQRRQQHAEKMQEMIKIEELRVQQEEKKQQMIQEERLRMLKEHAKHLIGFIPPGVLQESDLEYLGNEVVEEYRKKEGLN